MHGSTAMHRLIYRICGLGCVLIWCYHSFPDWLRHGENTCDSEFLCVDRNVISFTAILDGSERDKIWRMVQPTTGVSVSNTEDNIRFDGLKRSAVWHFALPKLINFEDRQESCSGHPVFVARKDREGCGDRVVVANVAYDLRNVCLDCGLRMNASVSGYARSAGR